MIDYEYQELFEQNSVRKEWRIQVFNGDILESVITNAELHADSIKLCQPLCTESMLTYGTCEASYIKFTVVSSVGQLKGKKLIVLFRFSSETETEYLQVGEFYVDSDELSDDRKSRDITAYDKIQTIINSDIVEWYSECGLPLNLKDFRDSFFEYFDLEQEDVELVNDDMVITETALPETISGLDVLQAICSGNGCLGRINNEGKFKYVFLNEPDTKNYGRNYKQGTLVYEDYEVKPITALRIYSNNDMEVVVGNGNNEYVMEDNFLFYDKLESVLTEHATRVFNIIKETPAYRVLRVDTYGDLCVEPGDMLTFTSYDGDTLTTFVLEKETSGLQALTDSFDTQGTEYFEYDLTSENSSIRRLWNNTTALQVQVESARTYVYAHRSTRNITVGHIEEVEIVNISIATIDNAIPVFLATIPLNMSTDGEITFRYYLDGLPIESDSDTIYLTKGEQFVTISNFFELTANRQVNLTVTAQTGYRRSVEREQTAKIISIVNWIQSRDTEVTTNNFSEPDYIEVDVDTTPPSAVITKNELRAMIFGSGLAPEEPWDGTITVTEPSDAWNLIEVGFAGAGESVSVSTLTPIGISKTEVASAWNLVEVGFANATDTNSVQLYTDMYVRHTEDGRVRVIEDMSAIRYTEGDAE